MAKTSLKQQVVYETRVAKTCPCKINTLLLLKFKVEGIFHSRNTLIYIFAVQSLHKRLFQAYTSLQQGTCVLYHVPILQVHIPVNGSVCAKSGGRCSHWPGSRSPQTFLYKIGHAQNFGHKEQAVFDHRDRKKQFSLYAVNVLTYVA